jgi:tetratricopeptide (TPR) repeat protein
MAYDPDREPLLVRIRQMPARLAEKMADLGAWIISPFERFASAVMQRTFAASEQFAGVESLIVQLLRALLWPVRMLWWLLTAATAKVLPRSVRNALAAPFHWLGALLRLFVMSFMRLAEALNLDGVVLRIVRWTRPIWYPFIALSGFFQAWLATRHFKQLLWAIPLLVLLFPLVAISSWTMIRGNGRIAGRYFLAVKAAREAKDYEKVRLYERKLAQLGVATDLADYQTAVALAQDGNFDEAYKRMQLLAPQERPGYLPAHYWMVQQLFAKKPQLSDVERQRVIKVHLDHLRSLGARGPDLDLCRAFWLLQDNKPEEAAKALEPLSGRFPQATMIRMEINIALGRDQDARRDARLVRTHMEDRARRDQKLSGDEWRAWSIAENLLGDVNQAYRAADEWYRIDPKNEAARRLLADLARRLFEQMIALPGPDIDRLTELFLQMARLGEDPSQQQLQIASLYRLRNENPLAQQVVDRVVNSPDTPANILEAVGTIAAASGDHGRARDYLQRAIRKDPRNTIALNNYAWLMAHSTNPDLNAALEAVNQAIEIQPTESRYRETRGQILVQLERWQEAVADLEFAVNAMPDSREVHLSLAKAYEALGNKQLAQVHREHIE